MENQKAKLQNRKKQEAKKKQIQKDPMRKFTTLWPLYRGLGVHLTTCCVAYRSPFVAKGRGAVGLLPRLCVSQLVARSLHPCVQDHGGGKRHGFAVFATRGRRPWRRTRTRRRWDTIQQDRGQLHPGAHERGRWRTSRRRTTGTTWPTGITWSTRWSARRLADSLG